MALNILIPVKLLTVLLISSCSVIESDKINTTKSTLERLIELNKNSNQVKPIIDITKEIVEHVQYPLIEVRSNDIIRQVLMIPLSTRDRVRYFTSGGGQSLTISDTLVTKTKGINVELISVETDNTSPTIKQIPIRSWPKTLNRIYHFSSPNFNIISIKFTCEMEDPLEEKIIFLEKNLNLYKVREKCKSKNLNFENIYWSNDEGNIIKSIQWVSPNNIYLEINKYF